jgi:hypothetical protein
MATVANRSTWLELLRAPLLDAAQAGALLKLHPPAPPRFALCWRMLSPESNLRCDCLLLLL